MGKRFHTPPPTVNGKTRRAFHRDLLLWYRRHRRDLPWRQTRDPYKIWVSEVMLQQTRVEVVCDYYTRWIRRFPTIESLARAPYSRVLKLWEGLGYYTRARNLHQAARLLARKHAGRLPRTAGELASLPGIGKYTAGAIASIAFGERAPVLDGNVARVLARICCIRGDVTKPTTRQSLWALAETLLPERQPGEFNQALMELGALVCTPARPSCEICPMRRVCAAAKRGEVNRLPNRGARRQHVTVTANAALVRRGSKVLVHRRPAHGLLANLWELPPLPETETPSARTAPVLSIRHTITNRRITLRVFECSRRKLSLSLNGDASRWVSAKHLGQLAFATAHRRALERIFSAKQQDGALGHAQQPHEDVADEPA